MQNIGYITLNISLIIYIVHFLPQTIHNQFKHTTANISLWTHTLMIIANSLDLVYAVGFNLEWQYILVDVILISFLFIQQLQILNDRKNKFVVLHTLFLLLFLLLVVLLILYATVSQNGLLLLGSFSGVIYNIYWLPQIYKNYKQKNAEGFSIYFLGLSLISVSCDISSAIFLGWPIISVITSVGLSTLLFIQIFQYLFYRASED
ncbi:PQ-loop repeat-containing protein [Francisellaceae bacterium CB299]|jgi:uncharacterized protein with PQ loop repeat